jgi:cytochrome P450
VTNPDDGLPAGGAAARPYLDPHAPGFVADPYPYLADLRQRAPVHQHPNGSWSLLAAADVAQALADPALSSSQKYALDAPRNQMIRAAGGTNDYLLRTSVATLDRPDHAGIRRVLAKPFTPKAISQWTSRAQKIVDDVLDGKHDGDQLRLIDEVGYPLPYQLTCEILGIPPLPDDTDLRAWTWKGLNLLDPFMTAEQFRDYTAAARQLSVHLGEVVAWKRQHLGDDLTSAIIRAADEGDVLAPDQIVAQLGTLFHAGMHTTMGQAGVSVLALLRNPAQWRLLVENPALTDGAVEELLRYDTTAQFMMRTTPTDYEIGGVTIPAGSHVLPWIASASRDEQVWGPTAAELNILRPNVRSHIAFGQGNHACLGSWLARLELQTIIRGLVTRFPGTQLDIDEPVWASTAFIRSVEELPLRLGH